MLDDTLSAVDHQTEARILDRLRGAAGDRSLLVASHRLSAVADADLILLLAGGRVREQGSHADLLRAGGEYAKAFALQRQARALGGED
jgi:ABC-type multidrug transport system fused ATPase/permease subunit